MTKQVKLSKNVHEKLLQLKEETGAKSINDVILALIIISEEFYINEGRLKVADKNLTIICNNGKIVEIKIE